MKTNTNTSIVFHSTLALLALALIPGVSAHLVGGNGFGSGITHPILGLDHLLAMVAVGIISVKLGGRALWTVPAAFVGTMVMGGILVYAGVTLPAVELFVAVSVLALGVSIAISKSMRTEIAVGCVALFALFHGHVHGQELSVISNAVFYTIGFVISTALLHVSGIAIGHYASKNEAATKLLRVSGAAMSVAGVVFIAAAL